MISVREESSDRAHGVDILEARSTSANYGRYRESEKEDVNVQQHCAVSGRPLYRNYVWQWDIESGA